MRRGGEGEHRARHPAFQFVRHIVQEEPVEPVSRRVADHDEVSPHFKGSRSDLPVRLAYPDDRLYLACNPWDVIRPPLQAAQRFGGHAKASSQTINGSVVTAKIAGIGSNAKIRSENSTSSSTTNTLKVIQSHTWSVTADKAETPDGGCRACKAPELLYASNQA